MSSRNKNNQKSADTAVKNTQQAALDKQRAAERRAQMVLSIVGFAVFGFLVGFLWGANQMIPQVNDPNPLCQAVKVGALIATNTADWARGGVMGILGMGIGGAFGSSLFLSRTAKPAAAQ